MKRKDNEKAEGREEGEGKTERELESESKSRVKVAGVAEGNEGAGKKEDWSCLDC